ncbi:trypsin-like serine peptidase [Nocardioides nitrophenolicus]|uniref:trypsin-like serine peptidase n=1 Tax=Nocardioides nitrophenolicus TaxID=60489 RepID=UPI0019588165|nr:hypothetical protein [Nocardioides nitrophenolicus]MBM7520251.1 V8-like Glu-specific endopeptidase [Nocardioides nitrophenolicus]
MAGLAVALVVALVVTLVVGVLGALPGASATPSGPRDPARPAVEVRPVPHAGVRDFWTPQRMRDAVPLDLGASGSLPGSAVRGRTTAAAAPSGLRSTGKLYFSDAGGTAVCSASSVNTAERNLIITAGHCVHGLRLGCELLCGARHYYGNFLFVPGYDHGAAPYGSWVGVAVVAQPTWVSAEDEAHDQALVQLAPRGGVNLVDVVGGNGLAWNYPAREDGVRVVGWPAQAPYDGESRQECGGSTTASGYTSTVGDAQIACPMTGGASGGPWFLRMAGADTGFIFAVTSRRPKDGTPLLFAVPFDSTIESLLGAARSAAARPVTGRAVPARPKRRLRLVAMSASVGYGETYQLVAETRRVRRIVLQMRTVPGGPWQRVARARMSGGVRVFEQAAPPGTRWYRIRERGTRRHSAPVAVTVGACPLPLDRSPGVLSAVRCTSPVG